MNGLRAGRPFSGGGIVFLLAVCSALGGPADTPRCDAGFDCILPLETAQTRTVLDLRSKGLTHLPPEIGRFKQLEKLYLDGNPLPTLPPEIGQLTRLTELTLGDSSRALTNLPPEIGRLRRLERLHIWRHDLRDLPASIGNLRELRHLMVAGGKELPRPRHAYDGVDLTAFGITGGGGGRYHVYGGLARLPETVGQLKKLETLTLTYHQVAHLPGSITNLTGLTSLRVEHGALRHLPEGIGACQALVELRINDNPAVARLPDSLTALTNLHAFAIAHNHRLKRLPAQMGNLRALRQIALRNTRLDALPASLGDLEQLRVLWIDDHSLSALPQSIGRLPGLAALHLNMRSLEQLPASFTGLDRLVYLNLHGSALASLPEWVAFLPRLRMLVLSGTGVAELPLSAENERYPSLEYIWCEEPAAASIRRAAAERGWILNAEPRRRRALEGAMGYALLGKRSEGNYLVALPAPPPPVTVGPQGLLDLRAVKLDGIDFSELDPQAVREINLDYAELNRLDEQYKSASLSGLPEFLKRCRHLHTLNLACNRLENLPDFVFHLPALRQIDLTANPIPPERIEVWRRQYPNLQIDADVTGPPDKTAASGLTPCREPSPKDPAVHADLRAGPGGRGNLP